MYKKILFILSRNSIVYFRNRITHQSERIIQCLSLAMIVVASGLCISIPFFSSVKIERTKRFESLESPRYIQDLEQLCHIDVNGRPWKYIVIHHSATDRKSVV